jgi:hydrolase
MFTGDNVLGHGGSVVVEDLGPYMNSLQVMTRSVRNEEITVGYPGHGAVIEDLPAKLIVWSRHWEIREKKVLSVFMKSNAKTRAPLTTREIIACLYGPELEAMAGPFITQVLSKLAGEGKLGLSVTGQEPNWFML